MNISIDIDGVLSDFIKGTIPIANEIWPGRVPLDYEPPNWDFGDIFSKQDWEQVWKKIHETPRFWRNLPPYLDNVESLYKYIWEPNCADIFYITSRVGTAGESVLRETSQWLHNMSLLALGRTAVLPVIGSKHKNELINALDIKYSLDDYGPTVVECNRNTNHTAYLLDRKWNREYLALPRVKSMEEYLDIVRKG